MKKTVAAFFAALCLMLTGCVSPAKIMTYRGSDTAFTVDASGGEAAFTARVTLPAGGAAALTFISPEEAEGITVRLDGGILEIGVGTEIPVKEEHAGGALTALLRVLSSSPEDVLTAVKDEFDGVAVYRCETADGCVYVSEKTGAPVGFSAGKTVARVTG